MRRAGRRISSVFLVDFLCQYGTVDTTGALVESVQEANSSFSRHK